MPIRDRAVDDPKSVADITDTGMVLNQARYDRSDLQLLRLDFSHLRRSLFHEI
jgi:hypothetical protein